MNNQNNTEYLSMISKPKYLCRWWIRTRRIKTAEESILYDDNNKKIIFPMYEMYVPFWAKPLDFIWKLIFGNPKLVKGNQL